MKGRFWRLHPTNGRIQVFKKVENEDDGQEALKLIFKGVLTNYTSGRAYGCAYDENEKLSYVGEWRISSYTKEGSGYDFESGFGMKVSGKDGRRYGFWENDIWEREISKTEI